ncbi:MAG: peptidase M75, Imelysin [Alphaproteobacteria bacterium]|nr:peptidase M75, Imelysin [Alphaproteobacteria bacterium]
MQRWWIALLLIALTGPVKAVDSQSAIGRSIDGYVIPNVERFAETADILVSDIGALCDTGSPDMLAAVHDTFRNAVLSHARIDFLRIGPLEEANRRDALLFWPDRRSTGLKQVQRIIALEDESVLDSEALRNKSVALQGFGALEFLLHGTGSQILVEETGGFRCLYALSIANNIAAIADAIAQGWQDEDGFARQWSEPGPDNILYRNTGESVAALVGMISNALEIIRDQRLKPIAPFGLDKKPYKRALFWRSGLTRDMLAASLAGLRDMIQISALLKALPEDRHWIAGSVAFEFDNALAALSKLDGTVQSIVEDPEKSSNLAYLVVVTRSLQNLLGEQVAEALGLPTTFSPLDGD